MPAQSVNPGKGHGLVGPRVGEAGRSAHRPREGADGTTPGARACCRGVGEGPANPWSDRPTAGRRRCRQPLPRADGPGCRRRPLAVKALHDLDQSFWKEPVRREPQISQRPPAMRRDRGGLVVAGTTRADLRSIDASKEMPLVLVEESTPIRELRPPTKNDRPEARNINAELLVQFSTRRCLGRLAILDAPAGGIPVRAPFGIWIKQEQEAILLVEQEHARNLALDHRLLLHRAEVLASMASASIKPTRCRMRYTLGASGTRMALSSTGSTAAEGLRSSGDAQEGRG